MIIIKGERVVFKMADGSTKRLPPAYGMIDDPDGRQLPKCVVFVGPCRRTKEPLDGGGKARAYFGSKYPTKKAFVALPAKSWHPVGEVVEILYMRRGKYAASYFHPFKKFSPTLSRSGRYYRLELRDGCIVDDRGFVFP